MRKTIARMGAIGGTARFVGKCYMKAVTQIDIENLKKDNQGFRQELNKIVDYTLQVRGTTSSREMIDEIRKYYNLLEPGMVNFTISILVIEAGYNDNSSENQNIFNEVIREELIKMEVGDRVL